MNHLRINPQPKTVHVAVQIYQGVVNDVEVHAFPHLAQARVRQWEDEGEGKVDASYLEREIIYPQEDLDELGLPDPYPYRLRRWGVRTVGHLCAMTRKRLYSHHGIGHKCVAEVEKALAARGLALAPEEGVLQVFEVSTLPTCQCEGNPEMFCFVDAPTARLYSCGRCRRVLYISKVADEQRWLLPV